MEQALGAPFSVFLTQYPFLSIGRAKNGCPVNYFQAGRIQPEGIMSLTTVERAEAFFWYSSYHKFVERIKESQSADANVVRYDRNLKCFVSFSFVSCSYHDVSVIRCTVQYGEYYCYRSQRPHILGSNISRSSRCY